MKYKRIRTETHENIRNAHINSSPSERNPSNPTGMVMLMRDWLLENESSIGQHSEAADKIMEVPIFYFPMNSPGFSAKFLNFYELIIWRFLQ